MKQQWQAKIPPIYIDSGFCYLSGTLVPLLRPIARYFGTLSSLPLTTDSQMNMCNGMSRCKCAHLPCKFLEQHRH